MTTTQLSPEQVDRLAAALTEARERAQAIAPLTETLPDLSSADAYAIAQQLVMTRLAAGARVVGHKIGLTSLAVQQQLGVDQPDYGALLDVMEIADGATIDPDRYIAPRVELELAFHLGAALHGPGVTVDDVRRATEAVQPAIELVDSRIADWRIRLADTIADGASSAGFVLGGHRHALSGLDVGDVSAELWRGDELVERGHTSAVLGDPCAAVAWLANALAPVGIGLEHGDVVLSGACTRMVAAQPGDAFVADFGTLGELRLTVAERR